MKSIEETCSLLARRIWHLQQAEELKHEVLENIPGSVLVEPRDAPKCDVDKLQSLGFRVEDNPHVKTKLVWKDVDVSLHANAEHGKISAFHFLMKEAGMCK